jgi:ribonuclease HII
MPAGFQHERVLRRQGFTVIIGVDEAGRGPLAGPVVAAAAVLTHARFKNRIDDSKKLTPQARSAAFFELLQKTIFGIGIVSQEEIDRVNIYRASKTAMERAVTVLLKKLPSCDVRGSEPECRVRTCVLVDGNMSLDTPCPCVTLISGDAQSKSIAAASIVAKVVRDAIMNLYDEQYPRYGFSRHKGYGTLQHRTALGLFGPSPIHRKSFHFK